MKKISTFLALLRNQKWAEIIELIDLKIHNNRYTDKIKEITFEINSKTISGKIAVYTCIIGDYDKIMEPPNIGENYSYYIFTDKQISENSRWIKISFDDTKILSMDASAINRYIKLHPHDFFPNYEYSVYIDGNIIISRDIGLFFQTMDENNYFLGLHRHPNRDCIYTEGLVLLRMKRFTKIRDVLSVQLEDYKQQHFPKHYGLFENTIILRKHNDERCIKLMEFWWAQLLKYTMRDQISLPYSMYCSGIKPQSVVILGNNLKMSEYFKYSRHNY